MCAADLNGSFACIPTPWEEPFFLLVIIHDSQRNFARICQSPSRASEETGGVFFSSFVFMFCTSPRWKRLGGVESIVQSEMRRVSSYHQRVIRSKRCLKSHVAYTDDRDRAAGCSHITLDVTASGPRLTPTVHWCP